MRQHGLRRPSGGEARGSRLVTVNENTSAVTLPLILSSCHHRLASARHGPGRRDQCTMEWKQPNRAGTSITILYPPRAASRRDRRVQQSAPAMQSTTCFVLPPRMAVENMLPQRPTSPGEHECFDCLLDSPSSDARTLLRTFLRPDLLSLVVRAVLTILFHQNCALWSSRMTTISPGPAYRRKNSRDILRMPRYYHSGPVSP